MPGDVLSSPVAAAPETSLSESVGPSGAGPVEPPAGAVVAENPLVSFGSNPLVPLSVGPNPAIGQPDIEMLRTPEAMLPPLGDTAQGSAGSRDGPPEAGGDRKRIRIRAVQFAQP